MAFVCSFFVCLLQTSFQLISFSALFLVYRPDVVSFETVYESFSSVAIFRNDFTSDQFIYLAMNELVMEIATDQSDTGMQKKRRKPMAMASERARAQERENMYIKAQQRSRGSYILID